MIDYTRMVDALGEFGFTMGIEHENYMPYIEKNDIRVYFEWDTIDEHMMAKGIQKFFYMHREQTKIWNHINGKNNDTKRSDNNIID